MMAVAEAFDGGDDHARIELIDPLPRETHAIQGAGAKILDQHVGFLDHLLEDFLPLRVLGVERQRALVAVEHREIQGVRILDMTELIARDVACTGTLHLDHVRAEPGEQLRAGGTRLNVREVDDLDTF